MTFPPPVNWPAVIEQLIERGQSVHAIALAIGAGTASAYAWRDGVTAPNYANGERLLRLWAQRTGMSIDQVPRGLMLDSDSRRVAASRATSNRSA